MRRSIFLVLMFILIGSLVPFVMLSEGLAPIIYDFGDELSHTAHYGNDTLQPPSTLEIGDPFPILNWGSGTYADIAYSDNIRAYYGPPFISSDYHRFTFDINQLPESINNIYVEHEGYASAPDNPDGLNLYIWNHGMGSWEYFDDHNIGGPNDGLTSTILNQDLANYLDSTGHLNVLVQTKENTGSCPFLYTFNGNEYEFVADLYGNSIIDHPEGYLYSPIPEDYAKIESGQLKPSEGFYHVQITQEYDEISYLDLLTLVTVDHSPEVEPYPSLIKTGLIHTAKKDLQTPLMAKDDSGINILPKILKKDGIYTASGICELDLGDLSAASQIKLVVSAYTKWTPGSSMTESEGYKRFVQVKDEEGSWINVLDYTDLLIPAALPRTYILDLTGKFLCDDYAVRLVYYYDVKFDYIGIDTSMDDSIQITELHPVDSDLHFRGYSSLTGFPAIPNYYQSSSESPVKFSSPSGNFTKFGDVTPLLLKNDNKFVIMHHGDEISAQFMYTPTPDSMDRDFILYSWGYYKNKYYGTGDTVTPLPFYGMTSYPYPTNESYPYDFDHVTYLQEYNIREYSEAKLLEMSTDHNSIYTDYVKVVVTVSKSVGGEIFPVNLLIPLLPYIIGVVLIVSVTSILFKKRFRQNFR